MEKTASFRGVAKVFWSGRSQAVRLPAWHTDRRHDLFLAAHARSLGATLVTNNRSEFDRVPELRVENWV